MKEIFKNITLFNYRRSLSTMKTDIDSALFSFNQ